MMPRSPSRTVDAIERRYCFAAWPQAFAHASWFDVLDDTAGLPVSRRYGPESGLAERCVAQIMLSQVDASLSDRVADDCVPWWAMQPHEPMRRHLSAISALCVLPALRMAVGGAEVRQWDAVLGDQVRHVALLLGRTQAQAEPPADGLDLKRLSSTAAKSADTWSRFCLGLGLAALADHGAPVTARVRLAWPRALRDVEALEVSSASQSWVAAACRMPTQLLRSDHNVQGLAA